MDGGNVKPVPKSFTETFEDTCSYYMSIGMTYNEFWYGEAEMAKYYREAHTLKCKTTNQELWLQGIYFIRSIQVALDAKNKTKYFDKPVDIFEKTESEKKAEAEKQRRKVIDYFTQIKQRWDNGNNRQLNT